MAPFAELAARSHYSFLEGSASPRRMVETAARLGIAALGLCDRNGLYGAVELIQAGAGTWNPPDHRDRGGARRGLAVAPPGAKPDRVPSALQGRERRAARGGEGPAAPRDRRSRRGSDGIGGVAGISTGPAGAGTPPPLLGSTRRGGVPRSVARRNPEGCRRLSRRAGRTRRDPGAHRRSALRSGPRRSDPRRGRSPRGGRGCRRRRCSSRPSRRTWIPRRSTTASRSPEVRGVP